MASSLKGFWISTVAARCPPGRQGRAPRSRRVFAMLLSSPWVLHDTAGRIVISLAGFLLGVIACALLAIVEYGAWALVVPPRPRLATEDLFERGMRNRQRSDGSTPADLGPYR